MTALFKANPRVKFPGTITYDAIGEQYVIVLSYDSLPGYSDWGVVDSEKPFLVWIVSDTGPYWTYGICNHQYNGNLDAEILLVTDLLSGSDISGYLPDDGVVTITIGPIVNSSPFFGLVGYNNGYTAYQGSSTISWYDYNYLDGDLSCTGSGGKINIPINCGAFRISLSLWLVDDAEITDGTYVGFYMDFDTDGIDPPTIAKSYPIDSFRLTDFGTEYVQKQTYISPVLFSYPCDHIRFRLYHDDTNENGLTIGIEFSVEFIPGYKNETPANLPPI